MPPLSAAAWMIWSQVTGCFMSRPAFSTNDLRYQRTWVLDQNGATTIWSSQVAACDRALEGLLAELVLHVLRDLGEVAGVRELRRERRVDAHDVDLRVSRREAPGQLDPLLVGVLGEHLGGDRVVVGGARLGDGRLASGVRVDVPGDLRAGHRRRRSRQPGRARTPRPVPLHPPVSAPLRASAKPRAAAWLLLSCCGVGHSQLVRRTSWQPSASVRQAPDCRRHPTVTVAGAISRRIRPSGAAGEEHAASSSLSSGSGSRSRSSG